MHRREDTQPPQALYRSLPEVAWPALPMVPVMPHSSTSQQVLRLVATADYTLLTKIITAYAS